MLSGDERSMLALSRGHDLEAPSSLVAAVTSGQLIPAAAVDRLSAEVHALVRSQETQNSNAAALNTAMGEFREKLVMPLLDELRHMRYNTGAKVEQTTTQLDSIVLHLGKHLDAIWKAAGWTPDQIAAYREQFGLQEREAPRAAEFSAYAEKIQELKDRNAELLGQNQELANQNARLVVRCMEAEHAVDELKARVNHRKRPPKNPPTLEAAPEG